MSAALFELTCLCAVDGLTVLLRVLTRRPTRLHGKIRRNTQMLMALLCRYESRLLANHVIHRVIQGGSLNIWVGLFC